MRDDHVVAVSVVVPAFNEAESLPELVARVRQAIDAMGLVWEIWVIDDGSSDGDLGGGAGPARRRTAGAAASAWRATSARPPRWPPVSRPRAATTSSPWTPTCRTTRRRSRN